MHFDYKKGISNFIFNNRYAFALLIIFLLAELIVNPLKNFPLNDDWSYSKSLLIMQTEGTFILGEWAAMTLLTHTLWGLLFTKIFGFSFIVLRMSTLVSSFIGLIFLNKLVYKISKNQVLAFISALTLLFNPLYFNMSNTYMTDVNFNTLLILCCYFAYLFFHSGNFLYYLLTIAFSLPLLFVRQYGIIIPFILAFTCLFTKKYKLIYVAFSLVVAFGFIYLLRCFEDVQINRIGSWAGYKFSRKIDYASSAFWNQFYSNLITRYKTISLHVLFYTIPISLLFIRYIYKLKNSNILKTALGIVLLFILNYKFFESEEFPFQNIFVNMALGTDTVLETRGASVSRTFSYSFDTIITALKYVFTLLNILVLIYFTNRIIKEGKIIKLFNPNIIFLLSVFAGYIFMLLITESYFDRYHIPLITIFIICSAYIAKLIKPTGLQLTLIPLLFFGYISVLGTKDYFTVNTNIWNAYEYLKQEKKADPFKINGGFEINCWNEGKKTFWTDFTKLENYDYLIQYNRWENFKEIKSYPFQRYFPYKTDTIKIFERIR